jgi:2-isopropylmalate synthase
MNSSQVIIFDTTLRDGEQSPGASMNQGQKLEIARCLEKLKVDVIEAGFAIASPGDFAAIVDIAKHIKDSIVCSLARALTQDVDRAGEAIKKAQAGRIHTFIATSPIHMQYKLKMTPEQVLEQGVKAIKRARQWTDDVEFSCEDAIRSDSDFLCRIIEAAIDAGAATINIPDTVGYGIPAQFGELIKNLIERIPNADKAVFSVHCHNDLGLAVANSLAAVSAGARQVECTINGLGERAGNASLEEIVMALQTRQDIFCVTTGINTQHLVPSSQLVSHITGFAVQPNKAIVGANAFAHEAGIHQDGILKHRQTYEIMEAQDVGWQNNRMVLGKHSGRNAFCARLSELGLVLDNETDINQAFERFKQLADKKLEVFDQDLQSLVSDLHSEPVKQYYQLVDLQVNSSLGQDAQAKVQLAVDGQQQQAHAQGVGPIDAVFKAIEGVAESHCQLLLYSVNAITKDTDSQGQVAVRLQKDGNVYNGSGTDMDVVSASAKAYVNALNALVLGNKIHPQYKAP